VPVGSGGGLRDRFTPAKCIATGTNWDVTNVNGTTGARADEGNAGAAYNTICSSRSKAACERTGATTTSTDVAR